MESTPNRHLLACRVHEAGALMGLGRNASYRAASTGQIPTLRIGRSLLVPVAKLAELLGTTSEAVIEALQ